MTSKQTYSVNNVKKLIDLNGDSTNFELTFNVISRNREPFDVVVVDQTTLDNNENLEYKKAENGEIGGTIRKDQNVYQNYFLVLKADNPCDCDVEINKKELPKVIAKAKTEPKPEPKKTNWTKIILIILAICCAAGLLYWFSKKKTPVKTTITNPVIGSPLHSPSPSNSPSSSHNSPVATKNPLLERLKNLNI